MRTFITFLAIASVWACGFAVGRIDRDATAKANAAIVAQLRALYAR
jgi:hypothetical protein